MANVSYKLKDLEKRTIKIGYVGENDHMHVLIDCKEAFDEYPNAVVTMAIVPPEGEDYPKTVTRNGNIVEWLVKNSDVAAEGDGEFQLTFTEDNVVKKSVTGRFSVERSISGNGTAPSGIDDWLTDANEKLAAVEAATQEAEDAASHAPRVGTSGYWETWDAETGEYVSTGTKAQGEQGDPGSPGDPTQLIDDTAGQGTTGKTWSADKIAETTGLLLNSIQGKYTKPSGGIPASDIADGVIPVVDSALSDSSENTVQNKVVKGALDTKAPVIINVATGNPAVFNDGGGMLIKSLLIPFAPKQSGTGDPSPENIRPFVPWNGLTIFNSGADTSNPTETDISFPYPVYGGELEAVSGKLMTGWKIETLDDVNAWTDGNPFISYTNHEYRDRKVGSSFIGVCSAMPIKNNVPSGTAYMRWGGTDAPNILIAPNGSGLTLEDVKTLSGQGKIVLAYPLATPTEQTLTGHQITAIVGNNTIWSDADGQMTVEYPADTETFIANNIQGLENDKYEKPSGGIPKTDLASDVQTSLGKADTALQANDVATAVDAWCDENITNPDSPPLDRSLTSSSAAAPADIAGELKSALTDISGPNKNLLYYFPWSPNGASASFVDDSIVITATSASTYRMAAFDIPINGHNTVTISYSSKSSDSQTQTAASIRIGFINGQGTNTWQGYVSSSPVTYNVSGVDKIKIALYVDQVSVQIGDKSTFNKIQVEYGDTATTFSKARYDAVDRALQEEVDDLEENLPDVVVDAITEIGFNKYNPDTKTTGYVSNNAGNININSDYFTSDFIDVSAFTKGYAFTPKARKILFYDANQNAISASYHTDETAAGVITIDSSYKYVRFSWYKTSTDVMVCDASTLPSYVPYEIVAKDGINYLNNDTKTKIQQMVGEGGKSTQIASYLNGKTVLVFGDSIMHGAGNNDDGIADLLADKYGMTGADYSVSGATMGVRTDNPSYTADEVHHIAKQVRNAISASVSPDLIIFDGGTNDIGGEIPIGTMSDVYTEPASESYFADGFETVAYLLMKNFVGVPIIYMRAHNMSSRSYEGQIDYGELGIKIAEKWGIRTIDMYKRMNTQLAEYRTAYLADYTHPNAAGYNKYYIPAIEDFVFDELVN